MKEMRLLFNFKKNLMRMIGFIRTLNSSLKCDRLAFISWRNLSERYAK
jgi:hypothetical protein